jgi:hypothetical protein
VKSTEARKPDSIPTFGRIDRKEKGALLAEARNRWIDDAVAAVIAGYPSQNSKETFFETYFVPHKTSVVTVVIDASE